MKILITGAYGFVGKNLIAQLKNIAEGKAKNYSISGCDIVIYEYDIDSTFGELDAYCSDCDFVFNLAGVNRPEEQSDFMTGNFGFASTLLDTLKKHGNTCPVMISSSTQAVLDNPYGKSKRAGEQLVFDYGKETGAKVLVYRFPNIFGKWCKPNYNSAVATFCYNIANDLPVTVNDPSVVMNLVYVDDVVDELIAALSSQEHNNDTYCQVPTVYTVKLEDIVSMLYTFKKERPLLSVPYVNDGFTKALYSTYLSYLPSKYVTYPLKMNIDERGSFVEFIRTNGYGQVSINVSKPGIVKGQHWHNNRVEKFLVVKGQALLQQRRVGVDDIGKLFPIENYYVCDKQFEVVEVLPGYTHNLINLSNTDELITIIWGNDCFDPERPDTYFEPV